MTSGLITDPEYDADGGVDEPLFAGLPGKQIDVMEPLQVIEHLEDSMFAKAMQEAYLNPTGKLGVKIMDRIVERQFEKADDARRNEADQYFKELNNFSESTLEKLDRGEIAADELVYDEEEGLYVLKRDVDVDVLEEVDEEAIPDAIPLDEIGDNRYDPEAWDDDESDELVNPEEIDADY